MEVREATPGDVHGIRRVAVGAWHDAHDEIVGPDVVAAVLEDWYDPDGLRDAIDRGRGSFLVAEADGEVVGFAQGGPSDATYGDAVLSRLYVAPERWNRGIGTALLDRLADRLSADGHETIWLSVLADNDVGVSFYRARGFERVEERTAEIFGSEAAEYVMGREL